MSNAPAHTPPEVRAATDQDVIEFERIARTLAATLPQDERLAGRLIQRLAEVSTTMRVRFQLDQVREIVKRVERVAAERAQS